MAISQETKGCETQLKGAHLFMSVESLLLFEHNADSQRFAFEVQQRCDQKLLHLQQHALKLEYN